MRPLILTILLSISISSFCQKRIEAKKLPNQMYSFKYSILGLSTSAEFLLDKNRFALNIEPSVSVFPILSSLTNSVSFLDILFPNTANAKITFEPKYYFLNNKKDTDSHSFNHVSFAITYHFRENNISKGDTTYSGLSLIPKFSLNSNMSRRIYFQGGIGYGPAFRESNYGEHLVKGMLGLDLKIAYVLSRK